MTVWAGSFLREDEKCWVSSSLFFHCVSKLSLQDDVYYLPAGSTISPTELRFYVSALESQVKLVKVPYNEEAHQALEYVKKVCTILKTWADSGFAVHLH